MIFNMDDPVIATARKTRVHLEREAGGSVRGLFELMRKSRADRKKSVLKEMPAKYGRRD